MIPPEFLVVFFGFVAAIYGGAGDFISIGLLALIVGILTQNVYVFGL